MLKLTCRIAYFLDSCCSDFKNGVLFREVALSGGVLVEDRPDDLLKGGTGTLLKFIANAGHGKCGLYNMTESCRGGIDDQVRAG